MLSRDSMLLNENIARTIQRVGYIVADFLREHEIAALREAYERLESGVQMGFFASMFSADAQYRNAVDKVIKDIFARPLKNLVQQHRCLLGSFLEKKPVPESGEVPLHQDWTFVNETEFQSLNFWCPLEDVDERNGCLWVLPGSHRFPTHPRAPFGPAPWITAFGQELSAVMIPVPMKKGEVLISEHRLWHASNLNYAQTSRLAAACTVVPERAEVIHYCHDLKSGSGFYNRYRVDEAFFCEYQVGRPPPGRYAFDKIEVKLPCPTRDQLQEFMILTRVANTNVKRD